MAGPLFRQLSEGVVDFFPEGGVLYTGHADTVKMRDCLNPKLQLVESPIYTKSSLISRLLSWFKYVIFITPSLLKSAKSDIFIISTNPPFLSIWIPFICVFKQINYILVVYDIYPDVLENLKVIKKKGFVAKIWHAMNRFVFLRAMRVVTISNSMAKRLEQKVNNENFIVSVVFPWVDSDFIKPLMRSENPIAHNYVSEDGLVILYSGNIGQTHNIECIINLIEHLKYDGRFKFVFFGDGVKRHLIELYIKSSGNSNVKLYPFQDEKLLPYTLSLGDISLVLVESGMEDLIIPSKLFSYLSAGSAILGISENESDLSEIINHTDSGKVFKPESIKEMADFLIDLYDNPSHLKKLKINSRGAAESLFNQSRGVSDFINILKDLKIIC